MEAVAAVLIPDPLRPPRPRGPHAQGFCEYGCGRRYTLSPGARLRGHPECLVELGDDLLGLMVDYPRLTYPRLAKDLGISRYVLNKIIQAAMRRTTDRARDRALGVAGIALRPRPLTPRQETVLRQVVAFWREVELVPTSTQLAERTRRRESTARTYLWHLRFNGWITYKQIIHLPGCSTSIDRVTACVADCPTGAR